MSKTEFKMMKTFLPNKEDNRQFYSYLTSSIAPRPICFASTLDEDGNPNLSPYSFFNVFGSNPPILVFSPLRRMRDNTTKDTYENILKTKEVVINVVNYDMVQQMSLSSCEYPSDVNEFIKSGFTPIASEEVKPFRVKESPVQMECKVLDIHTIGSEGGAANLIVCEVVKIHIRQDILDQNDQIDPQKIDLVARMGLDYYCRAQGDAIFEVPKPNRHLAIGLDQLPEAIRNSHILTGNDLAILANVHEIPEVEEVDIPEKWAQDFKAVDSLEAAHLLSKKLIKNKEVALAWKAVLLK